MSKAVLVIFFSILLASCGAGYRLTNTHRNISNRIFGSADTLMINSYVICNSERNIKKNPIIPKGGLVLSINEDSVMTCFQQALEKAKIPVIRNQNGTNFCDDEFHRNVLVKDRKINHQKIIDIAKRSADNALVLVPVIYVDNVYEYRVIPSPSGFAFGGNIVRNVYLNIAIYIVENEEIVFFRSGWHGTNSNHESFDEEPIRQTQENWDKLVAMVMSDYLKRAR